MTIEEDLGNAMLEFQQVTQESLRLMDELAKMSDEYETRAPDMTEDEHATFLSEFARLAEVQSTFQTRSDQLSLLTQRLMETALGQDGEV
jgi:hypothetical protein